jgi:hypothetical protein
MTSLERLAEASALLRTVENSDELTVAQRDACTHIRGNVDVLASSIETLQDMDGEPLRTDGGTETLDAFDDGDADADYSLPPRDECDLCGRDLQCWWHYLDDVSDTIDRERIEEERRRQGVMR